MKAAYVVHAREKAHLAGHVERCVRAAFAQTGDPIEILLSDQGSEDGTLELLQCLSAGYDGPHNVRVLSCPDTQVRGMAGLNAHVAWLMAQVDVDVVLMSSADDYSLPERTQKTLEAFERTGADMVGTAMWFKKADEDGYTGRSSTTRNGWATVEDMVAGKMGGSSALAWRKSFWERVLPIPSLSGYDVYLPPMAVALGGFWHVGDPLHVYVQHADANNTGLEGVLRALAENDPARRAVDEHRFFQTAGAYQWVLRRMKSIGVGCAEDVNWIREAALAHYEAWLDVRTEMTVKREAPRPFAI